MVKIARSGAAGIDIIDELPDGIEDLRRRTHANLELVTESAAEHLGPPVFGYSQTFRPASGADSRVM